MKEFVNLDEQEYDSPIIITHPHAISNIKEDSKILDGVIEDSEVDGICADYDIISIDKLSSKELPEDEEEHICIKDDCDVSKYYGCTSGNDGFQKENLFSELTDEYQRTIARINLGIADEYALKWGNITGNLLNQKDLYTFVTDSIASDMNKLIDEINLKLAQWACEINIRLENKADIYSPQFKGEPTTTLPSIDDNSNRIASTEWVNARLASASYNFNLEYFKVTPDFMYIDDKPTKVTVTWKYKEEVESQFINDVELSPDVSSYTFNNISEEFTIILKYYTKNGQGSKSGTFQVKCPIYYGVSSDITKNEKTIYNLVTVTANEDEYIYIMVPNSKSVDLSVNGIIGGFKYLGIQEVFSTIYHVYKSVNSNLGKTTIKIINEQENTLMQDQITELQKQIQQLFSKNSIILE